jgi:hypothetical protein
MRGRDRKLTVEQGAAEGVASCHYGRCWLCLAAVDPRMGLLVLPLEEVEEWRGL